MPNDDVQELSLHTMSHTNKYLNTYKALSYKGGNLAIEQFPMFDLGNEPRVNVVNDGLVIDIRAANRRHAEIIAKGIVRQKTEGYIVPRHSWRDQFRK